MRTRFASMLSAARDPSRTAHRGRSGPAASVVLLLLALSPALLRADSATNSYEYDDLNRLTAATLDGSRVEYTYDAAGNITRVFTPYAILLTRSGTGSGVVSDDLGKLACGEDCEGVYDRNTVVTLSATPDAGSTFGGWSGTCSGTGPCVVDVTQVENVGAAFVTEASPGADLVLTKTDGLTEAIPGQSTEYTITVSNNGPDSVDDAQVTDTFPTVLDCSWTSAATGGASGSAGSGSGDISEILVLPSGGKVTYTATCTIAPEATGALTNSAGVTSAVTDPNPGDESDSDDTALTPRADLWLTKDASVTQIGVGGAATYTVAVGSRGPSRSLAVTVVDTLPGGSVLVSATGTGWSCDELSGVVTCSRAQLDPGDSAPIEMVIAAPGHAGTVFNLATVSSTTTEHAPGDESDSVSLDVFGAPTVVDVGSVASTESDSLPSGTRTYASLTQIYLVASHGLFDPFGSFEPADVTNSACYRIFQVPLGDPLPATTCSDPTDVVVDLVTYGEAGQDSITLYLNGGAPLEQGTYRLLACGSGTNHLQDVFGSPLDGDGDGIGGDDFQVDFEVMVTNLLVNPNFDGHLSGWAENPQGTGEVSHDPASDASDAATSGSAWLVNLSGAGSVLELSQCVDVLGGESYLLGGKTRSSSLGASDPIVAASFETFDGSACSGTSLGTTEITGSVGDTAGSWRQGWVDGWTIPTGAISARLTFRVSGDELATGAWLDNVQFYLYELFIFSDGFESGDTTKWSGGQP